MDLSSSFLRTYARAQRNASLSSCSNRARSWGTVIEKDYELIELEPPENIYSSWQEAFDAIHAHSVHASYDVGILRHEKNINGSSTRLHIKCVFDKRLRNFRNHIDETRAHINRRSMKLGGCPMKLLIKAVERNDT
ncbi:hypothetical protein OnM2_075002 [Erysiphe neolycopersici]|uniref:Uncharacterized protein n=1 Tax=Erysiphe neolycopersici TaxID=212602 RepID=A0A420HIU2_9PEZI|nr:hypothetical protein OnM2_075002 [Erysiphe neolycopersici]